MWQRNVHKTLASVHMTHNVFTGHCSVNTYEQLRVHRTQSCMPYGESDVHTTLASVHTTHQMFTGRGSVNTREHLGVHRTQSCGTRGREMFTQHLRAFSPHTRCSQDAVLWTRTNTGEFTEHNHAATGHVIWGEIRSHSTYNRSHDMAAHSQGVVLCIRGITLRVH